jgi:hypothetical protein
MGLIYFDLDGVLRNLHNIEGFDPQNWDDPLPNGQGFLEYIDSNINLLRTSQLTKYAIWIQHT